MSYVLEIYLVLVGNQKKTMENEVKSMASHIVIQLYPLSSQPL